MFMTEKGFAKLEKELEQLVTVTYPQLSELMTDAQIGGDLLDNTEYLVLREELSIVDRRIKELQTILRSSQLIVRGDEDGKIHPGSTVVLQNGLDEPITYTIVGSAETEPEHGFISYACPLGLNLLDREAGDDILVDTPDGSIHYHIVAVS